LTQPFSRFNNVKTGFRKTLIRIFDDVKKYCLLLVLSLGCLFGINKGTNAAAVNEDDGINLPTETYFSAKEAGFLHDAIRISSFQNNVQPQVQQGFKKLTEFDYTDLPVYSTLTASFSLNNSFNGLYAKSYLDHIHPYHHFW
jgi:hypothetical protein